MTTAAPCRRCEQPTTKPYRLCGTCLDATTVEGRRAQGLPDRVEDLDALDRIARLATSEPTAAPHQGAA